MFAGQGLNNWYTSPASEDLAWEALGSSYMNLSEDSKDVQKGMFYMEASNWPGDSYFVSAFRKNSKQKWKFNPIFFTTKTTLSITGCDLYLKEICTNTNDFTYHSVMDNNATPRPLSYIEISKNPTFLTLAENFRTSIDFSKSIYHDDDKVLKDKGFRVKRLETDKGDKYLLGKRNIRGENLYIVAFKGCNTLTDLWNHVIGYGNIAFLENENNGMVHEGFYNAMIRCIQTSEYDKFMAEFKADKNAIILFSGHSMGGAMAVLAAAREIRMNKGAFAKKVLVTTFGEPAPGDETFANRFRRYLTPINYKWFENYGDIATEYCGDHFLGHQIRLEEGSVWSMRHFITSYYNIIKSIVKPCQDDLYKEFKDNTRRGFL